MARRVKRSARVAAAMMLTGLLSHATGACPVCGRDVHRTHAFDGARLLDTYACRRCGPTAYRVSA